MHEPGLTRLELQDESKKATRLARIEELEDGIFENCAEIVNAGLCFSKVSPSQKEPPPEWVASLGLEAARQKLELAKAMWLPQSLAPSGFKFAVQCMTGISRGRGGRVRLTQNNLNVNLTLPAPTSSAHPQQPTYEVRDLET